MNSKYSYPGNLSQNELPLKTFYRVTGCQLPKRLFKKGWHYCLEWDGLLLTPGDLQMQLCTCYQP